MHTNNARPLQFEINLRHFVESSGWQEVLRQLAPPWGLQGSTEAWTGTRTLASPAGVGDRSYIWLLPTRGLHRIATSQAGDRVPHMSLPHLQA